MGLRKTDGDCVIAKEAEHDVCFGFDRLAIYFVGTISPPLDGSHSCSRQCMLPAKNIDFSNTAIRPDHCFQTNLAGQGWIGHDRVAEAAVGSPEISRRSSGTVVATGDWERITGLLYLLSCCLGLVAADDGLTATTAIGCSWFAGANC